MYLSMFFLPSVIIHSVPFFFQHTFKIFSCLYKERLVAITQGNVVAFLFVLFRLHLFYADLLLSLLFGFLQFDQECTFFSAESCCIACLKATSFTIVFFITGFAMCMSEAAKWGL